MKRCYASLWSERVLVYVKRSGLKTKDAKMAVLVQHMVPSRSAGVMFTVSPLSTDGSEFLIESTLGLGEALVSGVAPQTGMFSAGTETARSGCLPRKSALRARWPAASREASNTLISTRRGITPSITDEQALSLATLGEKIEKRMGTPQDMRGAR